MYVVCHYFCFSHSLAQHFLVTYLKYTFIFKECREGLWWIFRTGFIGY